MTVNSFETLDEQQAFCNGLLDVMPEEVVLEPVQTYSEHVIGAPSELLLAFNAEMYSSL